MIKASIDIGSNAILLLIGELTNGHLLVKENESNVTGLGRELDNNKKFILEAMDDSYNVLAEYAKICKKYDIKLSEVIVTATEASRVAGNAKEFFKKIEEKIGFKVSIITSKAEAYYSTAGILLDKNITEEVITIMDIGGASTELIQVEVASKKILHSFSMPIGAVRMNNWKEKGISEVKLAEVLKEYSDDLLKLKADKVYCVAGTMTSIANMYLKNKSFKEDEVHGLNFKTYELVDLSKKYEAFSPEDFLTAFPFLGKRSQTISSGIVLAKRIFEVLDTQSIYISTFGLRYGTAIEDKIAPHFLA